MSLIFIDWLLRHQSGHSVSALSGRGPLRCARRWCLCDDVLDHHGTVGLSLSPETGVGLLVQLQGPCQPKPNKCGASGLKIESVTGRSGMDDCYRDFAVVPVLDILTGLQLPDSKALFDALQVVLKPVGHQHRFSLADSIKSSKASNLRSWNSTTSPVSV